jgi:hypothetical protein
MPRATPKHVTHSGTATAVLDDVERGRIVATLDACGFDRGKALVFADGANRAAVFAYELEPRLSTHGQSRRWWRAVLIAASTGHPSRLRQLLQDSADRFEGRAELERQLLHDDGGLQQALDALRKRCEVELEQSHRQPRRSATRRQLLAEGLVREWRIHFDKYPVYWIEDKLPPFLDLLGHVMLVAEAHYLPGRLRPSEDKFEDLLRNLTKAAIAADRRRLAQESQGTNPKHR